MVLHLQEELLLHGTLCHKNMERKKGFFVNWHLPDIDPFS
jgi:hypothetical protein